ncbi:hypothetical protein [Geodermatophilus sp. DSM 44513]|uniref:hypothetical protein n=1 Tax=Geodermatophilus sp. DSM 44513 TaxID=1528104 RepID=UPI0014127BBC|nr:hypothetical protein [Geodermatophilus sp. DSM 44513]WNV74805.1 hypothetical protein RTG05_17675 [Geodermatophilus sp. DSM 44513]
MGTAARTWAAVLLLAAVFLGHGLQCDPAGATGPAAGAGAGHAVHVTAVPVELAASLTATPPAAGVPAPAGDAAAPHHDAADVGGAPGHGPDLPGHLWAACLAVLAAGLAVLLGLAVPRLLARVLPTTAPARLPRRSAPPPLRPPDPFFLCVLRT